MPTVKNCAMLLLLAVLVAVTFWVGYTFTGVAE